MEVNVRPISQALAKLAEAEINENPQNVASNIQVLKDWWNEQPHLRSIDPQDQWLVAILRGSKHNLDKSRQKLEKFYTLKSALPDFYADRDPTNPKLQDLFQLGVFIPLRKSVSETSPKICIVRVGGLSSQYRLADSVKAALMIAEILLLEDDNFTIAGEDILVDMKGVGFNILRQWTPAFARKVIMCSEKALSVRIKNIYIINAPRGVKAAVAIFLMFTKAKLKNRIHVYNKDYEGVYDFIPRSVLPVEYGGTEGSVKYLIDYWKSKLVSYRDWFLQFDKIGVIEAKASEDSQNVTDVNISFRTLELD